MVGLVAVLGALILSPLARYAHMIPLAALAGVLFFVAGRLIKIGQFRAILRTNPVEFALAMVSLQNTVAVRHLGAAVGTLGFTRNLGATMTVAIFGAIVLAGRADETLPLRGAGSGAMAIPVEGFSRIFFAAALSMTVAPRPREAVPGP